MVYAPTKGAIAARTIEAAEVTVAEVVAAADFFRKKSLHLSIEKVMAMTKMQMNAKKWDILNGLMSTDDEQMIDQAWIVFGQSNNVDDEFDYGLVPGLARTREELIEAVREGEAQIRAGQGIPMDEVFKPYEKWL